MFWNTIPNEERLRLWKQLREESTNLQLMNQLENIAKFCSDMPIGHRSVDFYNPSEWPTPWEILFYGSFCASSISLLIFYTLILISPGLNLELILVDDKEDIYLLPIIDNAYVLNYQLGNVIEWKDMQDEVKLLHRVTRTDIKTIL